MNFGIPSPSVSPEPPDEVEVQDTFQQIRRDRKRLAAFMDLEKEMQRHVFTHLWEEYSRLREVEKTYDTYRRWCPAADRDLYTSTTGLEESDGNNSEEGGGNSNLYYRERWNYRDQGARYAESSGEPSSKAYLLPVPRLGGTRFKGAGFRGTGLRGGGGDVVWSQTHLSMAVRSGSGSGSESECDSERCVELCDCAITASQGMCICVSSPEKPKGPRFGQAISSQLLLYRLNTVFGMPPKNPFTGYKTSWSVELELCTDPYTVLLLEDYRGGPIVRFEGSEQGSESAIELLNWLISNNVKHDYDGILAGTVPDQSLQAQLDRRRVPRASRTRVTAVTKDPWALGAAMGNGE
ncbi:hypothetical protein A1O3_04683 [Capronia epimyces CBS 606.96]|uniref:Uncharacterized protein n=1 Tax=Capronia epimyces CBS 606.96 TaxID=1182542 RepID=W9Y476_9EURO|nr:uncharacterized protein A1O3_04683 [Capronia epimyces CBS 606.96]EXJ84016.1 hypothetical protein A1O3_04683 [Capronia epimyces CBS 606.96]